MATKKATIDYRRFTPDKSSPQAIKSRRYIDSTTGLSVSRRQATELSIGTSLEKRAAENKERQIVEHPTEAQVPSKLPRKSRVKNTKGEPTPYYQFKVNNLGDVATYASMLPPDTIMTVKAKGRSKKKYPKKVTRKLKSGRTIEYQVAAPIEQWRTLSGAMFRADEANRHLVMMASNANEWFGSMSAIYVIYKPAK